jgi:alpha-mannosidase
MHKHPQLTQRRLQWFASEQGLRGRLYPQQAPVRLSTYAAPDRIPYSEAVRGDYRPARVGDVFGPAWSTHWFRVEIAIPQEWAGQEVHLLWNSSSEACVWQDGQPVQGLTGTMRPAYRLTRSAQGGEQWVLYVEMACNGLFGTPPNEVFPLKQAEIAVFDSGAWELLWDFTVIADMAAQLPPGSARGGQALRAANAMANACYLDDADTWPAGQAIAAAFFAAHNGDSQHNLSAVGHAHIDTAWLWPLAETRRKCVRTFSTALRLMEDYPEYKFVASQAQQYAWIKESHPALYEKIKARVREGRFIPVGGTWVEPDCNLPSGESLVRQFLLGQRFFRREFGITCREFWNPDVFGYSAALPQIMRGAGIQNFLTQKLSWNEINKPANQTFVWEGLDGSRVLTHFPPADTYSAEATVKEVLFNLSNFKEYDRARESYMLFGYGDGGGGPTPEMLERLRRMADVDGLPRVTIRPPGEFFERCAADIQEPATWVGELYFEFHRGTYTTQAAAKSNNRRSELLLRDVEFLGALAALQARAAYPSRELERLWQLVLINQFHDILPGSSIHQVYEDAARDYAEVLSEGARLRQDVLHALFPSAAGEGLPGRLLVVNTLSAPRTEVVELPMDAPAVQYAANGRPLAVVSAPAMGYAVHEMASPAAAGIAATREEKILEIGSGQAALRVAGRQRPTNGGTPPPAGESAPGYAAHPGDGRPAPGEVRVIETPDEIVLENELIRATFRRDGRLTSLVDLRLGREAIAPGGAANHLVLFEDEPVHFDAWDVFISHLEKRRDVPAAHSARVLESGPLRAAVEFTYRLSSVSQLTQIVSLTSVSPRLDFATQVDWHERNRFLKVEFPLNVRADYATYEIQFGYVQRPTHSNTSYDVARFEVCAHRWADLSEPGFGVAVLNDCKYGYSTQRNVMRLSLLRASKSPDPEADMGQHEFRYALLPHAGSFQEAGVIEEAHAFNAPLLLHNSSAEPAQASFFGVDRPSVIIDAVKKAEDSDALIVRLYEAHGGRGPVRFRSSLPVVSAWVCNLLEEDDEPLAWEEGGTTLEITPFQLVTLKLECQP